MNTKTQFALLFILFAGLSNNVFSQTLTLIEADDSNIQYEGRIDFSNPKAPTYSYPGVSISAKFSGTSITAVFNDYGAGGSTTTNYYNVFIDNQFVNSIKVLSSITNYPLISGLSNSTHTVLLTKRTESSVGKSSFKGFFIESTSLLIPDDKPTRKIEFIGDSWTCGYGNEYSGPGSATGFHSIYENNYAAWGAISARRLNAQYHCTAYSGRGLYRNLDGKTSTVVPNVFGRIFPNNASPTWNYNNYVPDVVVIHLGTNDFSNEQNWVSNHTPLDSALYVDKYIGFVSALRSAYGSATKIVCVNGSSINTDSGLDQYGRWNRYLSAVLNHFTEISDNNVYTYTLTTQLAPFGEDWHPAKHEHLKMANQIVPYIQQITGWVDCASVSSGYAYLDDCKICVGGNTGNSACKPSIFTDIKKPINTPISNIVYPNPTHDNITLPNSNKNTTWTIFNQNGQPVMTGSGEYCEISTLKQGKYYVSILNEQHSNATFIVE